MKPLLSRTHRNNATFIRVRAGQNCTLPSTQYGFSHSQPHPNSAMCPVWTTKAGPAFVVQTVVCLLLSNENPPTIAISFAILEQYRVIHSQAERARYIVICINPAFTKMIDGTEKPKIPSKFAKYIVRYNEFRCKYMLWSNGYLLYRRDIFFLQRAMTKS